MNVNWIISMDNGSAWDSLMSCRNLRKLEDVVILTCMKILPSTIATYEVAKTVKPEVVYQIHVFRTLFQAYSQSEWNKFSTSYLRKNYEIQFQQSTWMHYLQSKITTWADYELDNQAYGIEDRDCYLANLFLANLSLCWSPYRHNLYTAVDVMYACVDDTNSMI